MNTLLSLLKNNYVKAILLSAVGLVALSFYRVWIADTIMVDGHNLHGFYETFVFDAYVFFLAVFSFCYYRLWDRVKLNIASVKMLSYLLVAIFSFMLPMLSNDIFSFIAYGDASNKGFDVYTDTNCLHSSAYFAYVSTFWNEAPCAYGPVSLAIAKLAAWAGNGNFVNAVIACKALYLIWAIIFVEVASSICQLINASARKFLFIVLNPLFLIQGLAQLHCDFIAITLTLCAVYFFFSKKPILAFAFVGLAVAAKISYVLVLPFLVVALFLQNEGWRIYSRRLMVGMAVALATVAIVYYPVYTSADTFLVTFRFVVDRNPCKSIAEVFGDILYFVPKAIFHNKKEATDYVNSISGISVKQLFIWNQIKHICQLVAIVTTVYILFNFWYRKGDVKQWFRVYVRLLLLFLLFYSHVFYAWYLMMFLPFVWIEDDKKFMQWLFVLTCLVNVQDIVCSVSRDSTVYYCVLLLTTLSVMVYLWRFRTVFIRSLGYDFTKLSD